MKITDEIINKHGIKQEEYKKIISLIGKNPNLLELGIFSAMWNEHCSYKSSKKYLSTLPTKAIKLSKDLVKMLVLLILKIMML